MSCTVSESDLTVNKVKLTRSSKTSNSKSLRKSKSRDKKRKLSSPEIPISKSRQTSTPDLARRQTQVDLDTQANESSCELTPIRPESTTETEFKVLRNRRVAQCIKQDRIIEDKSIPKLLFERQQESEKTILDLFNDESLDTTLKGFDNAEIEEAEEKYKSNDAVYQGRIDSLLSSQYNRKSDFEIDNISVETVDDSEGINDSLDLILADPSVIKSKSYPTSSSALASWGSLVETASSETEDTCNFIDRAYRRHVESETMAESNQARPEPLEEEQPRQSLSEEVEAYMKGQEFTAILQGLITASIGVAIKEQIEPRISARVGRIESDIKKINKTLHDLKVDEVEKRITDIQKNIETADVATVNKKMVEFDNKLKAVKTTTIMKKMEEFEEKITDINPASNVKVIEELDHLQQQLRLNNLLFSGIPQAKGEKVEKHVCKIAKDIGVNITTRDIDKCFRTGEANDKRPKIILVKFNSGRVKRDIYRARIKLRPKEDEEEDMDAQDENKDEEATQGATGGEGRGPRRKKPLQIFINEDLTPKRAKLYKEVRAIALPNRWQCWTENGVINFRNTPAGPPTKITNEQNLKDLKRQLNIR
jgi:hypothetical protein